MSKFKKLKHYGVYYFKKREKIYPGIVVAQQQDELFIIPLTKRNFIAKDKFFVEVNVNGNLTYACVQKMHKMNLSQRRKGLICKLSKYDQSQLEKSIKEIFGL